MKQNTESVKVVVRCRPLNATEISQGHETSVNISTDRGVIELKNIKSSDEAPRTFTFDSVYDCNSKQSDVYDEIARPLVESVLAGFNGTVFAYGQTGTGKTFTMEGNKDDPELWGIIPRSFQQIFDTIACSANQQYLIRASYLEIYQEEIRDLLHKDQTKRLELKERPDLGVYVKDLSSFVTKSVQEIQHVMSVGNTNRTVGATAMNATSSRSHAIFIITIECSEPGADGKNHIRVGRLNMVDLAGSERQSKAGTSGERLKEGNKINLSLSALGNVISALVDGKSTHIPYRDSKLTRMLQDSLGGNAKTVMITNIGPASYNYDETISTLRYANRAKNIKNKPKINEDPKDALLREFQEEITRLKQMLDKKGGSAGSGGKSRRRSRKVRVGENGESITEDGEEGEGVPLTEEEFLAEQQARLAAERESIMQNSTIIDENERAQLLAVIEERAAEFEKQREAQMAVASKIRAMESKLLSGGDNIVDKTVEQEQILQKRRLELAEQKKKEREILQQLEHQEENMVEVQTNVQTLAQEVDMKTKKLKKMIAKIQQIKTEMADLGTEHSNERQELDNNINELTKELKLKLVQSGQTHRILIIENFVPEDVRSRVLDRAVYEEDSDQWTLQSMETLKHQNNTNDINGQEAPGDLPSLPKRPVACADCRRPTSHFGKIGAKTAFGSDDFQSALRFRSENVLMLNLDMPERTTKDYVAPDVSPELQDAIDQAIHEEDKQSTLLIDASQLNTNNKTHKTVKLQPKSSPSSTVTSSATTTNHSKLRANVRPMTGSKNARAAHTNRRDSSTDDPPFSSAQSTHKSQTQNLYPKARGLVRGK